MSPALDLDEADRQAVLLALARLSIERPGWDEYLNGIALRIDTNVNGRASTYDQFRTLSIEEASPAKLIVCTGCRLPQDVADVDAREGLVFAVCARCGKRHDAAALHHVKGSR